MRVIAGNLGRRTFNSPAGHKTHPMSDKARGGLFNSLGDITGLAVLDAFTGSGALSFEAISRGAKFALAIDIDKNAASTVQKNVKELGINNQVKVIRANVGSWSDNNPDEAFDLVLADPPYDKLPINLLQKLTKHVQPNGLFIISWPGGMAPLELMAMSQIKQLDYGDAQLVFYRRV